MRNILCTLVLLVVSAMAVPAMACTSFLVGKLASTDGSTIISYNADSYGMFGSLKYYPAARHAKGTMRRIVDGDTNHFYGVIPEAAQTYAVMGYINEHQLAITETTFGGREELVDTTGIIDYNSLMTLALQRARTAREAIQVMGDLVQKYGYNSEGESFSIADPDEVWIMEMIGKGPGNRGAVWVAVRIPDDCIAAHANQSRIRRFDPKDKDNVICSKDVISFARQRGFFSGKDADFSFCDAYAPANFGAIRYCETRVWSFYNRHVDGMDRYLDYADGRHIGQAEPMPLYFKPKHKLSVADVMASNRDHYEGTPFDVTKDVGAGMYCAPYRPTPLSFTYKGKKYFNERPISTQQTALTVVAQMRRHLPNAIGGVLWFGNDDPNMVAYTPVYCCADSVPPCYNAPQANDVTFSWQSAFWVCNWVANMTYPRYSMLFPSVQRVRDELEQGFLSRQAAVEAEAARRFAVSEEEGKAWLTHYSAECGQKMLARWKQLGEYLIVKYNDMTIKPEADGRFLLTPDSLGQAPIRPGYSEQFKEVLIRETGDKYLVPETK